MACRLSVGANRAPLPLWNSLQSPAVNVHDYPHDALGRAVPYGVYDLTNHRGLIYLGSSGDTPAFAADAIAAWWQTDGRVTWPTSDHVLLLADAGGSNSCQTRVWKERLQVQICLTSPFSSQKASLPRAVSSFAGSPRLRWG